MKNTKTNTDIGVETREKILSFIADFKKEKGYLPNQSQIANGIPLSRTAVCHHFTMLKDTLVKKYPEYKKYKFKYKA